MVDDNGIILCSNESWKTGTVLQTEWFKRIKGAKESRIEAMSEGTMYTLMKRVLPYQKCTLYAVINNDVALQDLYNMPLLILICAVTAG